jgi:hypothetical protein
MPTLTAPPADVIEPATGRPRRHPRAVVALALSAAAAVLWCCALVLGASGLDAHTGATCSLGAALAGAGLGITALEAIRTDPERWTGLGFARASTMTSAAPSG